MKRTIGFLCAILTSMAFTAGAAEITPITPYELVKSTADEVLSIIRTTKDKRMLRELVEKKVLTHFDFRLMTQIAVGQHWRQATPAQQKALEDAFRTLLVHTYTASLSVASTGKESVDVRPLDLKPSESDAIVRSMVRNPGRAPISVDYRMARTAGGWKVYDVIVENLSLVTNYRSSFASEIRRSGIEGLVRALDSKNRELAQSA